MSMLTTIRQNSIGLAIFAIITAGAIAFTQAATKDRIAENRAQAQAKALYEIIPKDNIDNDLLRDTVTLDDARYLGFDAPIQVHIGRKQGEVQAVIIPVIAPDGYTGNIDLLVGINANGSLAGLRVLAHQETPGLGDKVETKKSDWVLGFENQKFEGEEDSSWAVKKDGGRFDQFTGATITPRAIVNASKRAILVFRKNKAQFLVAKPTQTAIPTQGSLPTEAARPAQMPKGVSNHG